MASVSSTGNSRFKIERCSPLWKYVEMVQPMPGGRGFLWIFSHCKEEYSSSYSRVKAHLCFIPQKGIKFCTGKPRVNEVLPKTLLPNHIVNKYIHKQKQADEVAKNANSHHLQKSINKTKTSSVASVSNLGEPPVEGHPLLRAPQESVTNKRAKGPLEISFQNEARDIAEEDIKRCIYTNGLSFNVVRSSYWQRMMRSVNEAPKGVQGPEL